MRPFMSQVLQLVVMKSNIVLIGSSHASTINLMAHDFRERFIAI